MFLFNENTHEELGFSVRFVACALLLVVGVRPAAAQSAGDRARLDDLAREAARKFAAASPAVPDQTRPTTPAASAGCDDRTDAGRGDGARTRTQPRHRGRAAQPADLRSATSRASAPRTARPRPRRSVSCRASSRRPAPLNGGRVVNNDDHDLQQRAVAVAAVGRRQRRRSSSTTTSRSPSSTTCSTTTRRSTRNFALRSRSRCCAGSSSTTTGSSWSSPRSTATSRRSSCAAPSRPRWPTCGTRTGSCCSPCRRWTSRSGSLDLADKLVQDNQARVEVGTLAPLDVVQAEAEAATRRQALAQAEAQWRTAGAVAEAAHRQRHRRSALERADRPGRSPDVPPEPLDVEAAVRKALEQPHRSRRSRARRSTATTSR